MPSLLSATADAVDTKVQRGTRTFIAEPRRSHGRLWDGINITG